MQAEIEKEARKQVKEAKKQEKQADKEAKEAEKLLKAQQKQAKKAIICNKIKAAGELIRKYGVFQEKLAKEAYKIPRLNFSCDNGYSTVYLAQISAENHLNYISVPKKNQYVTVDNSRKTIETLIQEDFLPQEAAYNELHKNKKNITAFTLRKVVCYDCQQQQVTLLIFRLNGSNKVTAIYSTDINIKAKTLRRHWFARTYIEQFFKLLKHYLKIHQSITLTKHCFEAKLFIFAFVALHCQRLIQVLRTELPEFRQRKFGFGALRLFLRQQPCENGNDSIHNLLFGLLKNTFCTEYYYN